VIAFAVQWIVFIPAWLRRTEHFYDLTGSLTYLAVVSMAVAAGPGGQRAFLLAGLVTVWALRLGTFLFRRVRAQGKDRRFDEIKQSGPRFFIAWTLQGLWVFLTLSAALAAIAGSEPPPLGWLDLAGVSLWAVGFGIEIIADRQKSAFRKKDAEGFIQSGLWAWSRHPNYFGEILLWWGVALVAASALSGWQWVTLISPIFVTVLLTKVSGIPLLEERAEDRWGDQPEYQSYRDSTPVLIPRPPK
jgi:steroid 5-alpha reductase family enzyme